jgi:hypothetical protein
MQSILYYVLEIKKWDGTCWLQTEWVETKEGIVVFISVLLSFRFCSLTSVAIILLSVTRIMCSVFYLAESYDMVLISLVATVLSSINYLWFVWMVGTIHDSLLLLLLQHLWDIFQEKSCSNRVNIFLSLLALVILISSPYWIEGAPWRSGKGVALWPWGHVFKSWKQPLVEMQWVTAYIRPKVVGPLLGPYASGS